MSIDSLLHRDAPEPPQLVDLDRPRDVDPGRTRADWLFVGGTTGVAVFVMVVVGAIGVFLGIRFGQTVQRYGWGFITSQNYDPERNQVGILAAIVGTVEVAVIALVVAFPLALCCALYITEYAPKRLRTAFVAILDLMAALPSIVVGAWGLFFIVKNMVGVSRWLNEWLGWMPWFSIPHEDARAADFVPKDYYQSAFATGIVVAVMVVPLAASVMRGVFAQTPVGEREAALALGSTRWGVIRTVVLPFGRGGIIGGTMLGLGRALGETVAVLFCLQIAYNVKIHVLQNGGITISQLVASGFGSLNGDQLIALLGTGFLLFLLTLAVNTGAAFVVGRSRSGAGVDA